MRRTARAVPLALAATLALAGCVAMPTSGPIASGVVTPVDTATPIPVPATPELGASPSDIMQGFLIASYTGVRSNFVAAREYLSDAAAAIWKPLEQVLVGTVTDTTAIGQGGEVYVTLALLGSLDAEGRYTAAPPGSTQTLQYDLSQDTSGQWRIDSLPNITVVPDQFFTGAFRRVQLMFASSDQTRYLPEIRFFPQAPNLGTYVVNAVLAGPSPWLAPAVYSPVPSGVSLMLDSVPIVNRVATVNLTSQFLAASPSDQQVLVTELANSLGSLTGLVVDTEFEVEGSPLDVVQASPVIHVPSETPFAVEGGSLVWLTSPSAPAGVSVPDGVTGIAGSASGTWVGLTAAGIVSLTSGEVVVEGEGLVAPALDSYGDVWTGRALNDGEVTVAFQSGATMAVRLDWLAGSQLVALAPSWDGTRLAIAYQGPDGGHVAVVAVVRTAGGEVLGVGDPISVINYETVTDIAWTEQFQIAALVAAGGTQKVLVTVVGGLTASLESPSTAANPLTALTAIAGDRAIFALTADGDVYKYNRVQDSWQLFGDGLSDLSVGS